MKNNNLIQEEINRAKQLWGYDTSKTIFEQTTGNTGTSNTCYAITSLTPCSGGTYGGYAQSCFSVNGVPGTQGHLGIDVQGLDGMIGRIGQTAPIPTTSWTLSFTQTTCPTTNTGTTGGPMSATINKCSGGTFSTWYSVTLNGNDLTQSDIGKTIMSTNPGFPLHGTLTAISPSNWAGGVPDCGEVPCPLPAGTGTTTGTNTGTTTGTTGGQFPGNFNPQTWWNTFLSNAQAKPWYATRKCNFFQNRINKWNTKLQSGVGPKQQNMLQYKIGRTSGEAVGEDCNFPGL